MDAQTAYPVSERTPGYELLAKLGSGVLAGIVSLTIILNAAFYEQVTSSRIMPVLVGAIVVHCCLVPRLFMCRELWMYTAFTVYLFITQFWTPDRLLAMNSLFPSVDFLFILVLYASLVAYHDLKAIVIGTLVGFWIGAVAYTMVEGFPFRYPTIFSYNAVAQMYAFALFYTCLLGWLTKARLLTLAMALLLMAHVLATTSIKTNLGIVLGVVVAMVVYFRSSMQVIRKNGMPLLVAAAGIVALILSNPTLIERVTDGFNRVALGVQVLQARESLPGYSGFEEREDWMQLGIQGWMRNPLFGWGTEAFRADFGITSHSTPVDLLYNTGLIGFGLFYLMFASMGWRLLQLRNGTNRTLQALIIVGLFLNFFVTLSSTVFYQTFEALFLATGLALLHRYVRPQEPGQK